MNILATEYSAQTSSFDIYVAGCRGPHCQGCFNPETWNFQQGKPCTHACTERLLDKIGEFDILIDNVMIMGGEPLDQDQSALVGLLEQLKTTRKTVWLFTKYDFDSVPDSVKHICDYIKCGRYDPSQPAENNVQHGVRLASMNQMIYRNGNDYGNGQKVA